jgi:hypothetical protein
MAGSLYVGRNGVTAWAMLTWGQVATSGEICLDDEDDDPNAIHAMIQHICDSEQTIYLSSPIPDLMFHVNVFAAADKYDVPSLRVLVVSKFVQLMNRRWSNSQQEFCTVVRHLYGPTAPNFADTSLQQSAITFCSEKIKDLIKLGTFASTLAECGNLAAELLVIVFKDKNVVLTSRCQKCKAASADTIKENISTEHILNSETALVL